MAGIISYPELDKALALRVFLIFLCTLQLRDMLILKRWSLTTLLIVDENAGKNADLKFLKVFLVPVYSVVMAASVLWGVIR